MPLYFFHVHDGKSLLDLEGTELQRKDVLQQALRTFGEILKDAASAINGEEWRMDVVDAGGKPVLTLRFSGLEH